MTKLEQIQIAEYDEDLCNAFSNVLANNCKALLQAELARTAPEDKTAVVMAFIMANICTLFNVLHNCSANEEARGKLSKLACNLLQDPSFFTPAGRTLT